MNRLNFIVPFIALGLAASFVACDDGVHMCNRDFAYKYHTPLPIPDEGSLADPHVIRVGCTWYLYATHSQTDLQVWYSDDLENWTEGPTIWTPTYPWQTEGNICGIWAPHVEPAGDGFYLYYTANCRIGVAFSQDPTGPFVDIYDHPLVGNGYGGVGDGVYQGNMILDYDDLAIDPFVLRTAGGETILFHNAFTPVSTIHAQRMTDLRTVEGNPQVMIEPDINNWEGIIREGSFVLEENGRFYLMYSGNMYDTTQYAMGVATSDDPMGPYTRDPRNPILKTNMDTGIYGPGHNSVAPGKDGEWLIFYHTKVDAEQGDVRQVRYGPLWFDEDGLLQVEQP